MTDKWKQIAAGTVISITGVLGLTNCENKVERKYKLYHEKSIYQEENEKVEFGYITGAKEASLKGDASTFEGSIQFANPDEEQVSAKQQKPEKKAPPKGSISKDAFVNELLARSRSRNGKK